jgi:GNAT superfamily N-acetyltransferase
MAVLSHFPIMHYHDDLETLPMEPKYELTDNPPPDTYQKMLASLVKFNEHAVGNAKAHTLAILLKEPTTDELVGGLWGRSLWGSLFVEILFVPAMLRGHGIGTSLLRQAEQEAIRRGCRDIWMETYAFQARTFYEKLGFTIFVVLMAPHRSSLTSSSRRLSATSVNAAPRQSRRYCVGRQARSCSPAPTR